MYSNPKISGSLTGAVPELKSNDEARSLPSRVSEVHNDSRKNGAVVASLHSISNPARGDGEMPLNQFNNLLGS